jgi:hypothetical protein
VSIWWWWWLGGGGLGVGFGAIIGVALESFFTGAEVDTGETLVLGLRVGDKVGVALGFTLIGVAVGTLLGPHVGDLVGTALGFTLLVGIQVGHLAVAVGAVLEFKKWRS